MPRRFRAGLFLLAALALMAGIGPLLVHDPTEILDPRGLALLRPGARRTIVELNDGSACAAEVVARTPFGWQVTRMGVTEDLPAQTVTRVSKRTFLLGTDGVGRDVLARVVAGARVSLAVGGIALLTAILIGVSIGLLAGWTGGLVDAVLMRLVDALLAVPMLFLVILLAALFQPTLVALGAILGLSSWMGVARLTRAQVRSLRERDFVLALRAIGVPPWRIATHHLFPNALTPLAQDAALRLGDLILTEASLSYLGFGVQPPTPSWGSMVADSQGMIAGAWWLMALPALLIALLVISAALLADGLQQATRPEGAA